ncbi:hypothetical protein KDW_17860 [Dictyobacter vulcani]|uniref:Uncharacterized protein n=1 Tax=Dictyobacter vulcani TaxID=2607529 RepID=A0A5J4KEE3_9CHLR|nr:hypothetical protein [Dictyobacter vulcani]GER87624.1 hypothetical protein KDW_17860 [Dictyobacter vulcani]
MEQHYSEEQRVDTQSAPENGGLASVGGGNIPGKGEKRPETASGVTEVSGQTTPATAGTHTGLPSAENANGQPEHGTLGGRNPGELNKNTGDRDKPREHSDIENTPVDPMISRTPDKVEAQKKADQQEKNNPQEASDQQ